MRRREFVRRAGAGFLSGSLLHPVSGMAAVPESYDKQFPDTVVQRRSSGTHDSGRIPFRRFVVSNRISLREERHQWRWLVFREFRPWNLLPSWWRLPMVALIPPPRPSTLGYLDGPTFARNDLYRTCIKPKRATQGCILTGQSLPRATSIPNRYITLGAVKELDRSIRRSTGQSTFLFNRFALILR